MAIKRIKLKAGEDVSPANIERVKEALENGCTKKVACEMLGIAYNTKRLQTIIEYHNEKMETEKRLRAKKRGKPVEKDEAVEIIKHYLSTGSVEDTAKTFFRSTAIVNRVLDTYGARLRARKTDYFNPPLLPDECVREKFLPKQRVWSSRHNAVARVDYERSPGVYAISVYGPHQKFAFQGVEDLGGLEHLEALGIDFSKIEFIYKETTTGDDD